MTGLIAIGFGCFLLGLVLGGGLSMKISYLLTCLIGAVVGAGVATLGWWLFGLAVCHFAVCK